MLFDDIETFCAGYRVWPVQDLAAPPGARPLPDGKMPLGWRGELRHNGIPIGTAECLLDQRGARCSIASPAERQAFMETARASVSARLGLPAQSVEADAAADLFLDDLGNLGPTCDQAAAYLSNGVILAKRDPDVELSSIVPLFKIAGNIQEADKMMAADRALENVTARLRIFSISGEPRRQSGGRAQQNEVAPTARAARPKSTAPSPGQ